MTAINKGLTPRVRVPCILQHGHNFDEPWPHSWPASRRKPPNYMSIQSKVRTFLIALLGLLHLCAKVSAVEPHPQWAEGLVVSFTGRGLEFGRVLDIEVVNTLDEKLCFTLAPFTVLIPSDSRYSPILLESSGAWDVLAGGRQTFRVSGFALDHALLMPSPGQALDYQPSPVGDRFDLARYALQVGLEVESNSGFEAKFLAAEKHRLLVLQRLIWSLIGEGNPTSLEELEEDLAASFRREGRSPSDRAIKALADSIWVDVSKCRQHLQ